MVIQRRRPGEPIPRLQLHGRYRIRVDLPHVRGQARRRKSVWGRTSQECLKKWRLWMQSGGPPPGDDPTVRDVAGAWLTWLEPHGPEERLAPSTWISYEGHMRLHTWPFIGDVAVSDLTPESVEEWLATLQAQGRSQAMRRKVLTDLRSCFKWALGRGIIRSNPASAAGLPRKPRAEKWKPLPGSEVEAIRQAIVGHRLEPLWMIALMLGPRLGELTGLWWSDLDRDARTIELGHTLSWAEGYPDRRDKTKTVAGQRTIWLPRVIMDALQVHEGRQRAERAKAGTTWKGKDSEPYMFTRSTGAPLRGDGTGGVGDLWKRALRRVGLTPRKFHATRHLASSLLLSLNGNNLVEVHQILGHSTFATTVELYGHLRPEAAKAVADLIDEHYAALRLASGGSTGGSPTVR
jgi:integrase